MSTTSDIPSDLPSLVPYPITLPASTYTSDLHSNLTEHLQWYGPGKLCPTRIGEELSNGRYQILLKLDHANHSLSWLARDKLANKWFRIDIVHASETISAQHARAVESQLRERAVLGKEKADEKGLAVATFAHRSPNGTHFCMVFPLNGEMNCFRWGVGDECQMNEAWFVRQCAKLRGGDEPKGVNDITQDEMVHILGQPRRIDVTPELRKLAHVAEHIRKDQLPGYILLRPDKINDEIDYWLGDEIF